MPDLKLPRLPDRTPVRLTVTVSPELKAELDAYRQAYEAAYGQSEKLVDLIPYMLRAFLDSDRGFAKAQKAQRSSGRG